MGLFGRKKEEKRDDVPLSKVIGSKGWSSRKHDGSKKGGMTRDKLKRPGVYGSGGLS